MVRFRVWPKLSLIGVILCALCVVLATGAALDGAWAVVLLLALGALLVLTRATLEYVAAASTLQNLLRVEHNG